MCDTAGLPLVFLLNKSDISQMLTCVRVSIGVLNGFFFAVANKMLGPPLSRWTMMLTGHVLHVCKKKSVPIALLRCILMTKCSFSQIPFPKSVKTF